jgi:hypothetical protein
VDFTNPLVRAALRDEPVETMTQETREAVLATAAERMKTTDNFSPFLPVMFRVNSRTPYSLADYAPMRALYGNGLSRKMLMVAGRQVSKSTVLAYRNVTRSSMLDNFRTLFVTPLFEQVRRFSANYVKPAIELSFIRERIVDPGCDSQVLQKSLSNGATMTFTYAFRDCDRARGIPCDVVTFDEVQDIDINHIPIIRECTSQSRYKLEEYAGTPKTMDNTIAKLWRDSSQGEWVIRCSSCGHMNVPSIEEDLLNMILAPGLSCGKCHELVDARNGFWEHKFPDRIHSFFGVHIPQPIMPMHFAEQRDWDILYEKVNTGKKSTVYNEVLGESCDAGAKIIPMDLLKKSSVLPFLIGTKGARLHRERTQFQSVSLGIDWGGHGEKGDSLTALVVTGLRPNGRTDLMHAETIPPEYDIQTELVRIKAIYQEFRCNGLGHDYAGIGLEKHTALLNNGFPRAMPWAFVTSNAKFFASVTTGTNGIVYVKLNRAMGIRMLEHELSSNRYLLPTWQEDSSVNPMLDLNSWFEDTVEHPNGNKLYRIMRSASQPDDVGTAAIYSSCTNWRRRNRWPQFLTALSSIGIVSGTDK